MSGEITQEILITIELADIDAQSMGLAVDTCLLLHTDAVGERWWCSRRKGHPPPHVGLAGWRFGRHRFHRWIDAQAEGSK